MDDAEIVREFLTESAENLAALDREMVALEREPDNPDLLSSIFRTVHTIKGTCGFLGFSRLERLAHLGEDILNELRQGKRRLDGPLTSLILMAVDGIKRILESIEAGAGEGEEFEADLLVQLRCAKDGDTGAAVAAATPAAEPPAVLQSVEAPETPAADSSHAGAAPHPAAPRQKAGSSNETALRVDVGLLDRLMNLVGELVLTRNQVLEYNSAQNDSGLNVISQRLNLITSELQEGVMKMRMQPIGLVWNKLPRIVRDLATVLGKEIDIEMDGVGTELDRTIIDAIRDPLTHIVRNCCDHGIETPEKRLRLGKARRGRLSLRAYHEGGQVNIEIADDGAGIDPDRVKAKAVERQLISAEQAARLSNADAVNLVSLPGFSTAEKVTNVSGRGVGMDVVNTHIERIGGTVELLNQPGQGMTVRVRIPLTLAIIPGLVVSAGGERFVIPQLNLQELVRVEQDVTEVVEHLHDTPVFRRRDALLPVADLSAVLGLASRRPPGEVSIVVVRADEHRFALLVDQIGDSQEIVVKPMGRQLKSLNCYAGATIMGDGRIALILDLMGLGLRSGVIAPNGHTRSRKPAPEAEPATSKRASMLLCGAGSFPRLAIPLAQVARLENIAAGAVENAGGRPAVQYRDRILPLLNVAEMLGGSPAGSDSLSVVVYRGEGSEIGLVVDEISDIVEESIGEPYPSGQPGVLGSALVGGRITDFLDLRTVSEWTAPSHPESLARLREALWQQHQVPSAEAVRS
jgi:two-component system, chemotaxis family, sensor kinase CheA